MYWSNLTWNVLFFSLPCAFKYYPLWKAQINSLPRRIFVVLWPSFIWIIETSVVQACQKLERFMYLKKRITCCYLMCIYLLSYHLERNLLEHKDCVSLKHWWHCSAQSEGRGNSCWVVDCKLRYGKYPHTSIFGTTSYYFTKKHC